MRRYRLWSCLVVLAAIAGPARAEPKAPRLVEETWDAAYLEGAKNGYAHTTVHEIDRDGKKILRTTLAMHFTIRRYDAATPTGFAISTDEAPDGKVVAVSLTIQLDKGMKLVQTGEVIGDQLLVRSPRDPDGTKVPWDDKALSLRKQWGQFRDRKVKPGDRFTFVNYEMALQKAVTVRVRVGELETVDLLAVKKGAGGTAVERVKRKLLRLEAGSDPVEVGGKKVPLPRLVVWLDKDRAIVRQQMDMPGLGRFTLYRTTREAAEKPGVAPGLLPDLGFNSLIALKGGIDHPEKARAIVYRITAPSDDDPATIFTHDARQAVRNAKGKTFDLRVRAVRAPAAVDDPDAEAKPEFLESSYFIDSDNKLVRELASRAAGDETDPWRKARRIEKWVHENMTFDAGVGFTPAGRIARGRKGDCRQHAMLTAALCRAARIPSRTAIGLVYVRDRDRGAVLGFHMWTEVWVKGQWLGLDAVQGLGGVGADHLKIADHSWRDVQTLAPLLPVLRALGKSKLAVEVVRSE